MKIILILDEIKLNVVLSDESLISGKEKIDRACLINWVS